MSYTLIFHPKAYEEYQEAWLWYEAISAELSERFETAVEKRLQKLITHPQFYSSKYRNTREVIITGFPFVIVYIIREKAQQVYIKAIFHTSRSPRRKYRR